VARVTNLRDALLPVVDTLRGIPAQLGLRQYFVEIVRREWTGSRVGLGYIQDTATSILVDLGRYQPKVVCVNSRDIIASGGLYAEEDLKVGPITPPFPGSTANGSSITIFDPPTSEYPTEIFFKVIGPGFPDEGAWFKKISQDVSGNFRYSFVIRKTAEVP
jgi:hypothetical protein